MIAKYSGEITWRGGTLGRGKNGGMKKRKKENVTVFPGIKIKKRKERREKRKERGE